MTILTGYFYRGRHRAPTRAARTALTVAALGAVTFAATGAADAHAAEAPQAGPLDAIAQCESGGDYRAQNPHSSASGKYQFLDSTWRAMGGTGKARNASPAEQDMRAQKLLAQQGTAPWNASRHCWLGKAAASSPTSKAPSRAAESARSSSTVRSRAANPTRKITTGASVVVKRGDTLSKIGQAHGVSWRELASKNGLGNPNLIFPGQKIAL